MAFSSVNGTIDLISLSVSGRWVGLIGGIGAAVTQWESGNGGAPNVEDIAVMLASAGGAATAFETPSVAETQVSYLGQIAYSDACNFGQDWYEKIHILPRVKIDFGNIITLVENSYWVHSAFRDDAVALATLTNNASPGIDFPNLTVPSTVYPMETLLDPTSTSNSLGIGLGSLVALKIQAPQDGLAIFDTNVVFGFGAPANDVELLVKGQRLVLMPQHYEAPVKEVLSWLTDVIQSIDGTEQRIALRKQPRQVFDVTYLLDGNDRQRMQALLFDWMDNIFGFPVFHERIFLTAQASVGTTTYSVSGADQVDLRVGGLALVMTNNYTYDVIEINSLTATSVVSTSPSLNAYPAGTMLMPLRTVRILNAVTGSKYRYGDLEEFRIQFEVTDNDSGAVTGSTTPGSWSIYNSRVMFDDPNFFDSGSNMQAQYNRRIYRIDNQTGKVTQSSPWDRNKVGLEKGFFLRNRADLLAFRKLLTSLRGKQKSFYLPTFTNDLTLAANLVISTDTMDIEAVEYVRLVRNRLPMSLFKITFTDGTSLVRTVTASATVSTSVERLTLNTTWPANRTIAQVSRIEFYELVRFDTDEISITHERIGVAKCKVPVLRVFDDN